MNPTQLPGYQIPIPVLDQGFNTITATSWVIGLACLWMIAWDYYVYRTPVRGDTLSEVILRWAIRHPVLAFSAGVVCGHFFWPQVVYVLTP